MIQSSAPRSDLFPDAIQATTQVRPRTRTGRPRQPHRILFVCAASDLYGAERCLIDVVEHLSSAWEPRFVVPRPGRLEEALRASGFPVDVLFIPRGIGRGAVGELRSVWRLACLIRQSRADLVHLNLHFPWPIVSAACLLARVPLVIHARMMFGGRPGRVERWLFQQAAGVICVSNAAKRRLIDGRLVDGHQLSRVRLIPDGKVLARFGGGDGERVRASLGISPGTPVVGMVARIDPLKGQDVFLRMARIVAERLPTARFLVTGGPLRAGLKDYLRELEELCRDPLLTTRVAFLGFREDIVDVLAALDCLVHPSRSDAFGSVLIEAMAAGVPVVAADVDGIPECVGRDGVADLVPMFEASGYADAVVRVLTDPEHREVMRSRGRERACRLFDIGPLARRTEEVFADCVGGSRQRQRAERYWTR